MSRERMGSDLKTTVLEQVEGMMKQAGPLGDILGIVEKKTGANKNLTFGLLVALALVSLVVGYAAQLLSGLIGFLYPAYHSIRALHEEQKKEQIRWLTYWVVFSFFHVLEFFSDHLVWWLPAYWLAKTLLLLWCMASPPYSGSEFIYARGIRPLYISYHGEIDSAVNQARNKAAGFLDRAADNVREAFEENGGLKRS